MINSNRIKSRIFLVGCPRSGTTLLQSLLAAHSNIHSFPESHFCSIVFKRSLNRERFGLISEWAPGKMQKLLQQLGQPQSIQELPKFPVLPRQYAAVFFKTLDTLTEQAGKSIWLEKTPEHFRYIPYLEKWLSKPKFIHIIRNGTDVIASLFEVTHQYPKIWNGPWTLDDCIQIWTEAVKTSDRYKKRSNHIIVRYHQLVENPSQILESICRFLDLEFEETMLENYSAQANQVVLNNEPWKQGVTQKISKTSSQKFQSIFTPDQQAYILEQIALS